MSENIRWMADEYEAWYKTPFGEYADRLEQKAVFGLAGCVEKRLLLDMGCGTGRYSILFSKRGAEVVAVDSSIEMLSFAKEKIKREGLKISLILGVAEKLPFKERCFDLAVSVTSLCFVESPQRSIEEMDRVAKKGGKVVVGALNKWSFYSLGKRISTKFKESVWSRARFYSIKELKLLLEGATWRSTLFALPWMPAAFLEIFFQADELLSSMFRPFGAFIVLTKTKTK